VGLAGLQVGAVLQLERLMLTGLLWEPHLPQSQALVKLQMEVVPCLLLVLLVHLLQMLARLAAGIPLVDGLVRPQLRESLALPQEVPSTALRLGLPSSRLVLLPPLPLDQSPRAVPSMRSTLVALAPLQQVLHSGLLLLEVGS